MFAAASGARLAHRHNQAVKKQVSASQIEGFPAHYKRQQQIKSSEFHGNRYSGNPQKRPIYSSKLYSGNCDSNLKLSSSFIEINGRISKIGHVDFEGKAAWQDRELCHELEPRESICIPSEAAVTHRTKQREAHKRWVKRNRIHDLSFGDCSSEDEELLYGVQNSAANLLLYVGLGTMCVGMIIAFVGTGEKGFKTMELRLIGPSLIGAGVLIIILRIMLCVCPSKCLKLKKHKQKLKNSTNKLNSEVHKSSQDLSMSGDLLNGDPTKEKLAKSNDSKKHVSIAMLPTTSGLSRTSSENFKPPGTPTDQEANQSFPLSAISFLEYEKPGSSKEVDKKIRNMGSCEDDEGNGELDIELNQLGGSDFDLTSFESQSPNTNMFSNLPETIVSPENSDISITSLIVGTQDLKPSPREKTTISKFEVSRNPKNPISTELVLSPSNLNEPKETDYS